MTEKTRQYKTQLAIIGAGIAGCAATLFALARGIKTTQIGNTGALAYTSGYLDLLGADKAQYLEDPWAGLADLRSREPQHPYAKIADNEIRSAFDEFTSALGQMGIGYSQAGELNHLALLPAGARKPTYCVPDTMQQAGLAMSSKAQGLIIDFVGLQGFSATEIVQNLKSHWPQLTARRISFPEMDSGAQIYPEVMARALEVRSTREQFAHQLKAICCDAEYLAMPAILGIYRPDKIHREMQSLVGLPIFEIPTIPPAVPGIRLRELFEQQLPARGAKLIAQQKVQSIKFEANTIRLNLKDSYSRVEIEADNVLLASGRFLSGGLTADQHKVRENLIDLPVKQPGGRENWFNQSYFDPAGHAINRSGLMVNDAFQPVDFAGNIIDTRLYAAGIVLAEQDWVRQRCGAGLAISTAFKAINSIKPD